MTIVRPLFLVKGEAKGRQAEKQHDGSAGRSPARGWGWWMFDIRIGKRSGSAAGARARAEGAGGSVQRAEARSRGGSRLDAKAEGAGTARRSVEDRFFAERRQSPLHWACASRLGAAAERVSSVRAVPPLAGVTARRGRGGGNPRRQLPFLPFGFAGSRK